MFRRITVLACALALLAGALSWTAAAAPITGSFTFDIVFYPQQACTVDPTTFLISCEDPINKIDRILVKFEADLVLTMSISGLELTSSTSFTFKGVETQIFWAKATVGAMVFETALVFAPNIMEFEEVRSGSGTRYYCLNRSAPHDYGNASGVNFNNCLFGSSAGVLDPVFGYWTWGDMLILGGVHPAIVNVIVGRWADGQFDAWHTPSVPAGVTGSMLDQPLTFRKKAAEVTLSIAGLTLGLRALFANFGTVSTPSFTVGTVLILEGTTVSGIKVRSETWVGARQGFECFGECKPNQRLGTQGGYIFVPYPSTGGIVVPGWQPEEEKLYISGLKLAGITHTIVMEMQFGGAAADSRQPTFVAIQSSTPRITPLGISITNIARFDRGFERFLRDQLQFNVSFGEASGVIRWDFRPNAIGAMESLLTLIYAEFDAPGATASITLLTCDTNWAGVPGACNVPNFLGYGTPNPFLEVYYDLLFEVGDMTVYVFADMYGSLLKDLYGFGVEATWAIGPVTLSSHTEFRNLMVERRSWNGDLGDLFVGTHPELAVQQFSIEIKF
ncbi:MAG: hypothetical protein ACK4HB_03625 [Candidatus Bipolaricaulia bacterium]